MKLKIDNTNMTMLDEKPSKIVFEKLLKSIYIIIRDQFLNTVFTYILVINMNDFKHTTFINFILLNRVGFIFILTYRCHS